MTTTVDSVLHQADIAVAISALAVLVPVAIFARTLRHYRALRTYGTTHLTAAQKLALEGRYTVVRRASRTTDALILVIVAMLIQTGVTAQFPNYNPISGLWGICG